MITVEEAQRIIHSQKITTNIKTVPISEALGYYLAEDICADRDFPPFNRVAMDGIAIVYDALQKGANTFKIAGIQLAGAPPLSHQDSSSCIEIMTGASLPASLDTIVRYEDIEIKGQYATIKNGVQVKPGQNIHAQGLDSKKHDVLIKKHQHITSSIIGVAATVGLSRVKVFDLKPIAIISTGDELVPIDQSPEPYQIRRSNVESLSAALADHKIASINYHLNDDKDLLKTRVKEILDLHDVVILSGGVSKGKADHVPEVLKALDVRELFHRVSQKPGKPLWFGTSHDGKLVFGLPGNPVSSFLCLHKYVLPLLLSQLSANLPTEQTVVLSQDIELKSSLTFFMQVTIAVEKGVLMATPVKGNGSGDLLGLSKAEGFVQIPSGSDFIKAGTPLAYIPTARH